MHTVETRKVWWTYDHAPTRWAIVGSLLFAWLLAALFLYADVVKILATRPWWEDFIASLATIAVPILAALELRHSAEANKLRGEANDERRRANDLLTKQIELEDTIGQLIVERDIERNKHLEQIAINIARPPQEPAASLKIHPANRSRYILRQVGQGGAHGDFSGGYFEFWLRVENSGNRNSTVDKYKIWIQEFDKEFNEAVPTRLHYVQGRHCQHALVPQSCLNEGSLTRIPADGSTNTGCLWFFLPELALEMFLNAGRRMQGPERRFDTLHCRLTLIDSNAISASGDFELSED